MPVFDNVTTKKAEQVWASPDGQRKIFSLEMEYQGQSLTAKTYSDKIATVGWSGTVESYEKPGNNGSQTFVKQPPKEGGYQPGGGGGYQKPGGGKGDQFTMYLSYAKDLLVALVETGGYEKEKFEELLSATIRGGKALYAGRPDNEEAKEEKPAEKRDLFGDIEETVPEQELPWPT